MVLSHELAVQVSDCLSNYPQLNLPGNQEKLKQVLLGMFEEMPSVYMLFELTEEGIYYTSFTAFAIKKFKQTLDLFLGLKRDLSSFNVIEESFKKELLDYFRNSI